MNAMFGRVLSTRRLVALVQALVVLAVWSTGATAQVKPVGAQPFATRAVLTERLATLQSQAASARGDNRIALLEQVAIVRARLENGDFKPGDRFVMLLRQDSVVADTLVVRDSLRVAVLNLPEFSVAGVLRAELEDRLGAHVSRFLRNAEVRTTQLTRVSVTGAVRTPGFYYAIPDRPINDLLTSAGGPLPEANLNKLTVTRVGKTVLSGKVAKRVVEEGQTLESLDIQSGDTVHVPLKKKINWEMIVRLAIIVTSLMFAMLQFIQWYYNRQDN